MIETKSENINNEKTNIENTNIENSQNVEKIQNTEEELYDETHLENEPEEKTMKIFEIQKKIGGGAEGSVYLALRKANNKKYAIKSITVHTEEECNDLEKKVNFNKIKKD